MFKEHGILAKKLALTNSVLIPNQSLDKVEYYFVIFLSKYARFYSSLSKEIFIFKHFVALKLQEQVKNTMNE